MAVQKDRPSELVAFDVLRPRDAWTALVEQGDAPVIAAWLLLVLPPDGLALLGFAIWWPVMVPHVLWTVLIVPLVLSLAAATWSLAVGPPRLHMAIASAAVGLVGAAVRLMLVMLPVLV